MKKVVLLFLFSLICCACFAQLQTNIKGLQLGTTNMNQAKNILTTQGFKLLAETKNLIAVDGFEFGDVRWDKTGIFFYEDKINTIFFAGDEEYIEQGELPYPYTKLKNALIAKYKDYILLDEFDVLSFEDDDTEIVLTIGGESPYKCVRLYYSDIKLCNRQAEAELNEL